MLISSENNLKKCKHANHTIIYYTENIWFPIKIKITNALTFNTK